MGLAYVEPGPDERRSADAFTFICSCAFEYRMITDRRS
jgi:hypothetical protein